MSTNIVIVERVTSELRLIRDRWAKAARSGQTSKSLGTRRMARDWAEQSRWFGLLAERVQYGQREPLSEAWSARLDSQPGRYVQDVVELSGPAISEQIRYVVEHLATVDYEAFAEYAAAARAVRDADANGTATEQQLEAMAEARAELEADLLGTLRLPVQDAQRVARLLTAVAGVEPAAGMRVAA